MTGVPDRSMLIALAIGMVVAACGGVSATLAPADGVQSSVGVTAAAPTATTNATLAPSPMPSTEPPMTVQPGTEPPMTAPPVTEQPATAPPPTAAPSPSLPPGIGVKQQIGDQQFMTVEAAEQWPGAGTVKPRKGKAFFTVSIRIDAIQLTSFDSADFKLKDKAGKSYAWRPGRAPHLYSLDNMTAGGTYLGWITYEIPKASLGELRLIYKPAFLGGTTFTIPLF